MLSRGRPCLWIVLSLLVACGGEGAGADTAVVADAVVDAPGADTVPGDTAPSDAADALGPDGDPVPDTTLPSDLSPADADGTSGDVSLPSPEEWAGRVEKSRLSRDLAFVAQPRFPGSDHWLAVQDLCVQRLEELGFAVERQVYSTGVNVVGTLPGKVHPEQVVVVSAHYDSVAACDGADDNASGVVGALEVARVLSQARFEKTLVVAFWDEEEGGLIGSQYYAAQARQQGVEIQLAYVFEMIGYRTTTPNSQSLPFGFEFLFPAESAEVKANEMKGDFLAVIADTGCATATSTMDLLGETLGLPVLVLQQPLDNLLEPALGDLQRSDHAAFWVQGYPAMMITDTSEFRYPYYHCAGGEDSIELLDLDFMASIVSVTVGGVGLSLGTVEVVGR